MLLRTRIQTSPNRKNKPKKHARCFASSFLLKPHHKCHAHKLQVHELVTVANISVVLGVDMRRTISSSAHWRIYKNLLRTALLAGFSLYKESKGRIGRITTGPVGFSVQSMLKLILEAIFNTKTICKALIRLMLSGWQPLCLERQQMSNRNGR